MGESRARPWRRVETRTHLFWVPRRELAELRRGTRTEVRVRDKRRRPTNALVVPCPIVLYSWSEIRTEPDRALLVLERAWEEPMGAISPESVRAEGFETLKEYRRYWIEERGQFWRPLDVVRCYRFRIPESLDELADMLLEQLYGEHLEAIPTLAAASR